MQGRMTEGAIAKPLILFTIPLVLSGLLQQLYSWADALIVGNFVGEQALAAIGATSFLSGMLISVIQGFSVGISILASHAFGEGDGEAVTRTAGTFATFFLIISLVLAGVGMAIARPLLQLMGTPADIIDASARYILILFAGLPFLALYNLYNAALRAVGDSRTPLLAIVVSALANVLLDLLFVAVFGLGVAGAAVATVLSQAAMAVFLYLYAPRKHALLRFSMHPRAMDREALRKGLRLSVPTSLQSGVWSIGGMLLQSVMNGFGSQVVAAITTAYRIDSIMLLPAMNIGAGISTFVGQNRGAGNPDRARRGLRVGGGIALIVSLVTTALFVLGGAALMRIFGVTEGAVAIGSEFLYTCAVFYPLFGLRNAFTGYLQGMGDVRFTAVGSLSALAVRVGLSYALAGVFGYRIIAYAEMAAWVYELVLAAIRYRTRFGRGRAADLG